MFHSSTNKHVQKSRDKNEHDISEEPRAENHYVSNIQFKRKMARDEGRYLNKEPDYRWP